MKITKKVTLKLTYEVYIWSWLWTWHLKLKLRFELEVQIWSLKLEVEIWNWIIALNIESNAFILRLKFKGWHSLFCSDELKKWQCSSQMPRTLGLVLLCLFSWYITAYCQATSIWDWVSYKSNLPNHRGYEGGQWECHIDAN